MTLKLNLLKIHQIIIVLQESVTIYYPLFLLQFAVLGMAFYPPPSRPLFFQNEIHIGIICVIECLPK